MGRPVEVVKHIKVEDVIRVLHILQLRCTEVNEGNLTNGAHIERES